MSTTSLGFAAATVALSFSVACAEPVETFPNGGGGGSTTETTTGFETNTGGTSGQGGACVGDSYVADPIPLDIFVMLDQSGSMLDDAGNQMNRWETIQAAFTTFVNEPTSEGIGIGLNYFGVPQASVPGCYQVECDEDADCEPTGCGLCLVSSGVCQAPYNGDVDSCDALDYAWAEVPIQTLPDAANTIVSNIASHQPGTNTPTLPALEGAIQYARWWKEAHPERITVVVLASDGQPSECDIAESSLVEAAREGFEGSPSVTTFVVGVGPALTLLDEIAEAGGSEAGFHVDLNAMATDQFLLALNTIRQVAIGCTYEIPEPSSGMEIDFGYVNVEYTPSGGAPTTIPKVENAGACPEDGNGWYFDDAEPPTNIILCEATCSEVNADLEPRVDVVLGCKTIAG